MKRSQILACVLLVVAGIGTASAHGYYRGGVRFGAYYGPAWGGGWGPGWGPPIYSQPYYAAPPVVILPPPQPPVYIEQRPAPVQAAPAEPQYWYYCAETKSYYPYVKECSAGWQKVLPQPER